MKIYKRRKRKASPKRDKLKEKASEIKRVKRTTEKKLSPEFIKVSESTNRHKEFIKFTLTANHKVHYHKINRPTEYEKDEQGIVFLNKPVEEKILFKRITLYPEAISYLFNLEGCPKKLFLFLLLFREEIGDEFIFNSSVISLFSQFCQLYKASFSEGTVKQAMKVLRGQNIVLNFRKGYNMMNPMITGGISNKDRERLIMDYNTQLLKQGLNPFEDFYPK